MSTCVSKVKEAKTVRSKASEVLTRIVVHVNHSKLVNKANKSLRSLMMKTVQLKNSVERRSVEESRAMKRKLSDVSDWLEEEFRSGEERRRERISLWSDRTQRLGNMGSMNTPTLEQIDQITSNMARLVKRTKIARVECNVLGETNQTDDNDNASQEERQNIFDDSDFYHHLLRELIEKKTSAGGESGETGKHWLIAVALQFDSLGGGFYQEVSHQFTVRV